MKKILFILLAVLIGGICTDCTKKSSDPVQENRSGGYTAYRAVTDADLAIFDQYYDGAQKLTPVEVATQVVAGTNYRFRCLNESGEEVNITIFVPLPCNQ